MSETALKGDTEKMRPHRSRFLWKLAIVLAPPLLVLVMGVVLEPSGDEPSDAKIVYWALVLFGAGIASMLALVGVALWSVSARRARRTK